MHIMHTMHMHRDFDDQESAGSLCTVGQKFLLTFSMLHLQLNQQGRGDLPPLVLSSDLQPVP